jgi:hypothetical protein
MKFSRLAEGPSKPNEKIKPGKFCPGGPKREMENVLFFDILAPMGKTRNVSYKEENVYIRQYLQSSSVGW